MFCLYQIILHLYLLVLLPKMFWERSRTGKYRESLGARLGRAPLPLIRDGERVIWIHAVSMGELLAIVPLAKQLKGCRLLVSTVSETGQAEARKRLPEADHIYLPFDSVWLMNRLVKWVSPQQLILSEGDLWPAFHRAVKAAGGRITLVSGKLSEVSMNRLKRFPAAAKLLTQEVDTFCVQNPLYADRFVSIGVDRSRIVVTGNLKFDSEVSHVADLEAWRSALGVQPHEKVVVIGSSHHPEEQWLLDALRELPDLRIILVPRHPERFDQVAALLHLREESYFRLSKGGSGRTVLVDAMGKLRDCYEVADVAIVAGSFIASVGGHNILEPLDYGVPTLFGPHMHTQQEMVDLVLEADAAKQVTLKELAGAIETLDPELGSRGRALTERLRGSLDRTVRELA